MDMALHWRVGGLSPRRAPPPVAKRVRPRPGVSTAAVAFLKITHAKGSLTGGWGFLCAGRAAGGSGAGGVYRDQVEVRAEYGA